MKVFDEVWAIDAKRVEAFFRDYIDHKDHKDTNDYKENVTIVSLPEKSLGSICLPQTRVIITGENAEELYHQFFLHFLSAGG